MARYLKVGQTRFFTGRTDGLDHRTGRRVIVRLDLRGGLLLEVGSRAFGAFRVAGSLPRACVRS